MSLWLQNLVALTVVVGCVAFITRGVWRALHGRRSKLAGCGSCGGCATTPAAAKAKPTGERVVFLPVELLVKRK